jgi:predicted enzyme related to lactoylglutathione lyase
MEEALGETGMKFSIVLSAAVALAMGAGATLAAPPLGVRDVRLGASDPARVAAFYQAVFGMSEVQRYERPGSLEIILGFGKTVEQARADPSAKIIVITPPAGAVIGGVSPLVLNVPDIEGAVVRVTANGGAIERAPARSATSGNTIAMIRDPAGNRVELIKEP